MVFGVCVFAVLISFSSTLFFNDMDFGDGNIVKCVCKWFGVLLSIVGFVVFGLVVLFVICVLFVCF